MILHSLSSTKIHTGAHKNQPQFLSRFSSHSKATDTCCGVVILANPQGESGNSHILGLSGL